MEYPEEFIAAVKKAYPRNHCGIHELLDAHEPDIGGILLGLANNITPESNEKLFVIRWGLYQKYLSFGL